MGVIYLAIIAALLVGIIGELWFWPLVFSIAGGIVMAAAVPIAFKKIKDTLLALCAALAFDALFCFGMGYLIAGGDVSHAGFPIIAMFISMAATCWIMNP